MVIARTKSKEGRTVKHNFVYLINFKHYYFYVNLTTYNNHQLISFEESAFWSSVEGRGFYVEGEGYMSRVPKNIIMIIIIVILIIGLSSSADKKKLNIN